MLNSSVVSYCDNFGLIFKVLEDKGTNGIENWSLSTTRLLIDAASRETVVNIRIQPMSSETAVSGEHLSLTVWEYLHSFSLSCLRKRGRKNL